MEPLTVDSSQRVGAIGRTGMGKTFLMEQLLRSQPRVLVLDSKHRIQWKNYHLTFHPDAALAGFANKVIYRPDDSGIPEWFWKRSMDLLHSNGGGILYIDEMPMITTPSFAPKGLLNIFRIGRELGVGVWWSAQESVSVANTVIRQTDVLAMFHNHGASDRDKLIGIVGDMGEATKNLEEYEFVVYRAEGVYDPENIDVFKAIA